MQSRRESLPGMEGNKQINQSKQTHNKSETKEEQQKASENETRHGERWGARLCPTARARERQPPSTPCPQCRTRPSLGMWGLLPCTGRQMRTQTANGPRNTPLGRVLCSYCGVSPRGPSPAQPPSPSAGPLLGRGVMGIEEQGRIRVRGFIVGFFLANTQVGPFHHE